MQPPDFDVAPVVPEAREIVRAAALAYWRATSRWFRAIVVHGSALKGGFIPLASDVDLRVYLDAPAFDATGELPFDVALEIHRGLLAIDPHPFQYVQGRMKSADLPLHAGRPGELRVAPCTYHVLAGTLPVPDLTPAELHDEARRTLARLPVAIAGVADRLLDHGGGRLARSVRLVATDVWPALYSVLALRSSDPASVWATPKDRLMAAMGAHDPLARYARAFAAALASYHERGMPPELGLEALVRGVEFLEVVRAVNRGAGTG